MQNVIVEDNFFTDDFLLNLYEKLLTIGWSYSNFSNQNHFPFDSILSKNNNLLFGKTFYRIGNVSYDIFNETPVELFESLEYILYRLKLKNHQLKAIDANLQVYGQDGEFHSDCLSGNGLDKTIIFFPMYKWEDSWGGEFQICNEDSGGVTESYIPKPGRVIYLDGSIKHRGLGPSVYNVPRISIAYRFKLLNNVNTKSDLDYN